MYILAAHMWFDYEVQVALGPHLADVSTTLNSYTLRLLIFMNTNFNSKIIQSTE